MVTELRDLMRNTAEAPGAEAIDVNEVLGLAKSRVRRRHTAVMGAAAATAVLAAVVAGTTFVQDDEPLDSNKVAADDDLGGRVIHLDDAVGAVRGADYDVLTTYVEESLGNSNGRQFVAVTPSGLVVYSDHSVRDRSTRIEYGLIDADSGEVVKVFPASLGETGLDLVVADGDWIVWAGQSSVRGSAVIAYNQTTDQITTLSSQDLTGSRDDSYLVDQPALGPDNRLYFTLRNAFVPGNPAPNLRSVSLTDPSDVRTEGDVGDFSITGNRLVYLETTNEPDSTVVVRDLTTGDETSFDSQAGTSCNQLGLASTETRIILFQLCGENGQARDDRVQIFTTSGEPLTTIQDSSFGLVNTTSRFVTMVAYEGRAGVYVYDLATDGLLRLTDERPPYPTASGADNLLTWTTPLNGVKGQKLWVARFS